MWFQIAWFYLWNLQVVCDSSARHYMEQGLGECHYECEICLQIAHPPVWRNRSGTQSYWRAEHWHWLDFNPAWFTGVSWKTKGHPWERAKTLMAYVFWVSGLKPMKLVTYRNLNWSWPSMALNASMVSPKIWYLILPIYWLILIRHFSLQTGDVIMTGTPAG